MGGFAMEFRRPRRVDSPVGKTGRSAQLFVVRRDRYTSQCFVRSSTRVAESVHARSLSELTFSVKSGFTNTTDNLTKVLWT